ncbi:MAG TPA: prolipoprotein diacylglyceryl transferase family protein [Burkholderiales bacterium]|nr:prolipoprotein diacylglyceryl transferase family protein [Burkholderiales bacterium]
MHPVLADFGVVRIYAYGVLIAVGVGLAWLYIRAVLRPYCADAERISKLFAWSALAAFVGGKALYFLEAPVYFANHASEALEMSGSGFVFYGSFLFVIPTIYAFAAVERIPAAPVFDASAIGGAIIHGCGKIGCLLAGCCYGRVSEPGWWTLTFEDPHSNAHPLHQPLYATQAYDALLIFGALGVLFWLRARHLARGRLMLVYAILYSAGRFFTEMYRGDEERGWLFDHRITHSQFIGVLLIAACALLWLYLSRTTPQARTPAR